MFEVMGGNLWFGIFIIAVFLIIVVCGVVIGFVLAVVSVMVVIIKKL